MIAAAINRPPLFVDPAYETFREKMQDAVSGGFTLLMSPPERPVLHGFFWSDCIHESGLVLQSLHATKAGAWRAMVCAQRERWLACRSGADSGLHHGMTQQEQDYRTARYFEAYAVRPVELLP